MAIKGKNRARSRKAVTRGPRPVYVPVKRPMFARRGVQIGVAAAVVITSGLGIWYGINRERRQNEEEALQARLQTAMLQYQAGVDRALLAVGQPVAPSGFNVLPGLQANLDGLKKGDVSAREAEKSGKRAVESASVAWEAIDGIDLPELIAGKGFTPPFTTYILDSQSRMVQGLQLYEQVGIMLQNAAQASGDSRADLIASAKGVLDVAAQLFADGYNDYTNAQFEAGVFNPGIPAPPIPGG